MTAFDSSLSSQCSTCESASPTGPYHVRNQAEECQQRQRADGATLSGGGDQPEDDQAGHEQAATADPEVSETLHQASS